MLVRGITAKIKSVNLKNFQLLGKYFSTQFPPPLDYENALDYKDIPRPSILTFIRDFMPGGQYRNTSFFDYAIEMRKLYGDIYVLPGLFGKPDLVMVFNTKDIEMVYRNEGQWPHRQSFDSIKHFREVIKGDFFKETTGLLISQGEKWGQIRSAVNPIMMKPQNLYRYLKPLQETSDDFIQRIKQVRDPKTFEVPENFAKEFYRLTFESIALVALNRKLGLVSRSRHDPDAEHLIKCASLAFHYTYQLDVQPSIWKIIRTPTYYKNIENQTYIFNITHKYISQTIGEIEEKKKRGETSEENYGVIEKLLEIDEKLAVTVAMDMLVGGLDTTSVTIMSILLCLAKNPEKQQKLREEILKVMPTKDTELNENNIKNLSYIKAVIKETLRYYPNNNGPFRQPIQNVVLSGYKVPKGSTVVMNANILLKEEAFFPQADTFLPERWLRDENQKKDKVDPFSYLPFGVGPRICAAKRLAELKMEVLIVKLIRNFEVEFHYDASKPFTANFVNVPCIPMKFTFKDIIY